MYENFEKLYIDVCNMIKEDPINLENYRDLDKCMNYIREKNLEKKFKDKGFLVPHENFPYNLPHDYTFGDKKYILYFPVEIELLSIMANSHDTKLNKWKMSILEKVCLHGWKYFCEYYINEALDSKYRRT